MSRDTKLSKAKISKIIQWSGSCDSWLANLVKKALKSVTISLARNNLLELVSNLTSNATKKFGKKISGKEAVWIGKGFTLLV